MDNNKKEGEQYKAIAHDITGIMSLATAMTRKIESLGENIPEDKKAEFEAAKTASGIPRLMNEMKDKMQELQNTVKKHATANPVKQ